MESIAVFKNVFPHPVIKAATDPQRTPEAWREFSRYEFECDWEGNFISGCPDRGSHLIDASRQARYGSSVAAGRTPDARSQLPGTGEARFIIFAEIKKYCKMVLTYSPIRCNMSIIKIAVNSFYCGNNEGGIDMSDNRIIPSFLQSMDSFSRREFTDAMSSCYSLSEPQAAYELKKHLEEGALVRVGWGRYSLSGKQIYRHQYSESSAAVVQTIHDAYEGLNFQIFELRQLNDFINHQVAHNTIFVSAENDFVDYVFDTLWRAYPGRLMLKPKVDQYYRYLQDDEIVVGRLPSETPKGIDAPWMSRLEKILVDVFTDKLISQVVPDPEKKTILDVAFRDYLVDENTMFHYAKRKGTDRKMRKLLTEYGKVTDQ